MYNYILEQETALGLHQWLEFKRVLYRSYPPHGHSQPQVDRRAGALAEQRAGNPYEHHRLERRDHHGVRRAGPAHGEDEENKVHPEQDAPGNAPSEVLPEQPSSGHHEEQGVEHHGYQEPPENEGDLDRKSTRLNSSHW